MLAELTERELAARYPSQTLTAPTERAVTSLSALREQLEEVRLHGYATNNAESENDVCAVGVAVKDRPGKVRGAVVVTGPRSRADQAWIERVAAATMRTAKELTGSIV
jgi:DNA-binding IclR family transcriptional regulator